MRHHPVTPMEDAHLGRLIERQGRGKSRADCRPIVARSPPRWRQSTIRRCAMWCSTPSANRICSPGRGAAEMKLVSGGSGLAIGLARDWAQRHGAGESAQAGMPLAGPAVVPRAPAR
uniref:Uncharacterized protein n=1 Tax=Klebsiella pneumoniae subsp. pneumoniae TaxID=72407 RepID=A0A7G3L8U4_KLEPN|nr:hypothetical protein PNDLPPAH_00437 [Klebsiella pneumoniae subsp. pneumoniae]